MNLHTRSVALPVLLSLATGAAWSAAEPSSPAASPPPEDSVRRITAPSDSIAKVPAAPPPESLLARADREVERWEAKTRAEPKDEAAWIGLASAYLQKARETNDPVFYTRAEKAVAKAQELKPDLYPAMRLKAELHSARHQFDEAIQWIEKALKVAPNDPLNHGLLSDIYAEIGDYDKAEEHTQKMIDLRPGRASYARGSYLRELFGDDRGAVNLMQMAISAGPPKGEAAAWCHTYLGHLYFNQGYLPIAKKEYEAALVSFPGYFHAISGLAKVKAAEKEYPAAIELYRKALESGPHHETLASLMELYALTGQKEKLKETRNRLATLQKRYLDNHMDIDFEVAEIDAEHGKDLAHAFEMAKAEVKTHGNVKAYDALAWIAYLNGDDKTALSAMQQALRLGTKNALTFYHAAKIWERAGDKNGSIKWLNKALSRCPYFHPRYAEEARSSSARLAKALADEARQTASKP